MRNNYGCDLDSLTMGSRIGMMRTAKGDLHYFINGVDQGVACSGLPPGKGENKSLSACEELGAERTALVGRSGEVEGPWEFTWPPAPLH